MTPTQCVMARAGLEMTCRSLAKKAGVSAQDVHRFEMGRIPRDSTAYRRLEATLKRLGCTFFNQMDGKFGLGVHIEFRGPQ